MIRAAIIFCLVLQSAIAATLTVSVSGSGLADGSDWNNTLAEGFAPARGNTYYYADGSYASKTFSTVASGTTLISIKKATSSDHVTETGWVSTMGDGQAQFVSFDVQTDYWTIDGNDTSGYGFFITGYSVQGIRVRGDNIAISSVEVFPGAAANALRGFLMAAADNVMGLTITHALIRGVGSDGLSMQSVTNCVFDDIHIRDRNTSDGTHADAYEIFPPNDNCTIRYGRIDWEGQQIFFGAATGDHGAWAIHGNRGYGGATSGKGIHVQSGDPVVNDVLIYGNSFYNLNTSLTLGASTFGDVRNNIFISTSAPSFGACAHNYNYFETGLGVSGESNGQEGSDPFTDAASDVFTLSFATTAGDSTIGATYNTDPLGTTRGSDGTWDRGAYEFSGTPAVLAPSRSSRLRGFRTTVR